MWPRAAMMGRNRETTPQLKLKIAHNFFELRFHVQQMNRTQAAAITAMDYGYVHANFDWIGCGTKRLQPVLHYYYRLIYVSYYKIIIVIAVRRCAPQEHGTHRAHQMVLMIHFGSLGPGMHTDSHLCCSSDVRYGLTAAAYVPSHSRMGQYFQMRLRCASEWMEFLLVASTVVIDIGIGIVVVIVGRVCSHDIIANKVTLRSEPLLHFLRSTNIGPFQMRISN